MTCASSPGAAMQRSCNAGGSGAAMGAASASLRFTYLGRTVRRQKKCAGS